MLDADIEKCFDRINHEALLEKLQTFSVVRRAVKVWLKAKIADGDELFPSNAGTPQGGIVSPLLANIALHGLETAIETAFPNSVRINGKRHDRYRPRIIRYADDFVVLHPELAVIEKARVIADEWLKPMGLQLKASKTQITHTFEDFEGKAGFDFLGFTVRQFPVGKSNYRTSGHSGLILDFKVIIKPKKEAIERHYQNVAKVIDLLKTAKQEVLIKQLNPIVRGWLTIIRLLFQSKCFQS